MLNKLKCLGLFSFFVESVIFESTNSILQKGKNALAYLSWESVI